MRLSSKLTPELVLVDPEVRTRDELFRLFGDVLHDQGIVEDPTAVASRLVEREEILSTGIGGGVAVPHAQVPGLGKLVMTASVHPDGIEYPALDDEPVRLVFCLLGDATTTADHLAGLARLARLARSRESLSDLVAAESGREFVDALVRLEES
jgi:mannitol/fructose-specific phosphotransferase system IIA component (Ntr-type)